VFSIQNDADTSSAVVVVFCSSYTLLDLPDTWKMLGVGLLFQDLVFYYLFGMILVLPLLL